MTYEEYLDEVTTLITEMYDLSDDAAIKLVMQAQADDFFLQHDEVPSQRNQDQAKRDAAFIFKHKK